MKIGILAVQGAFIEHVHMLESLGAQCVEIRQASDLNQLDGIVLPGGESTVQSWLLHKLDMFDSLKELIENGLPTFATCAGMILLAQDIEGDEDAHLQTLPVRVRRNAYGRQLGSFSVKATVGTLADYPQVYIRAPFIVDVLNKDVEVLAQQDSHIVAVKYKNQIALAFHPELTEDTRLHEQFLQLVAEHSSAA